MSSMALVMVGRSIYNHKTFTKDTVTNYPPLNHKFMCGCVLQAEKVINVSVDLQLQHVYYYNTN